jgi:hypothetical protein
MQSSQWMGKGSPRPKKARMSRSEIKVLLAVFWYLYVLGGVIFRMTLGVVPSDRDVRTRSAASRNVDLETCCGRSGGREIIINAIWWGAWYYSIVLNPCRVTSMADTGIDAVKKYIGCTLLTCDMYMCRLRHINDSVLSSLKMEGMAFFKLDDPLAKSLYCVTDYSNSNVFSLHNAF